MSGLIACRAADTSTDSAGPVAAAAALVAAWTVNVAATRDAARQAAVTDRGFRHRRVPTTVASSRRRNAYRGHLAHPRVHRWLLWPVHVHSRAAEPLAVPELATSRHSPDCVPVTEPSAPSRHFWLAPPWQDQMIAA